MAGVSKYRNKPTQIGEHKYRSQKEAKRHQDLLLLQKSGHISGLRREVPYELVPAVVLDGRKKPAIRYVADFVYSTPLQTVVEDCKGMRTPVYRMKRHMMKSLLGLDVLET